MTNEIAAVVVGYGPYLLYVDGVPAGEFKTLRDADDTARHVHGATRVDAFPTLADVPKR